MYSVLNVVPGLGSEAGAHISQHTQLDKVAFTGSVATGATVATASAKALRPCTLELGGKSPIIAFADCNIEGAVDWIVRSRCE